MAVDLNIPDLPRICLQFLASREFKDVIARKDDLLKELSEVSFTQLIENVISKAHPETVKQLFMMLFQLSRKQLTAASNLVVADLQNANHSLQQRTEYESRLEGMMIIAKIRLRGLEKLVQYNTTGRGKELWHQKFLVNMKMQQRRLKKECEAFKAKDNSKIRSIEVKDVVEMKAASEIWKDELWDLKIVSW